MGAVGVREVEEDDDRDDGERGDGDLNEEAPAEGEMMLE